VARGTSCTLWKKGREERELTPARILIVEDEPNIAESLHFLLVRADFDVEIVTDGAEALRRLRGQPYSAVVLDVMLPGMNGFDVLRAIRSDGFLAELPVIVLTAKGQANDRRTAEAIGASAFITKPFSNADVVACVRRLAKA
jgi:DNA-binding response OmpR family regulator